MTTNKYRKQNVDFKPGDGQGRNRKGNKVGRGLKPGGNGKGLGPGDGKGCNTPDGTGSKINK